MKNTTWAICVLSIVSVPAFVHAQYDYGRIITGLKLNYVLNGRGDVYDEKFTSDSVEYYNAVHNFYAASKEIIPFILKRFDTCTGLSGLIVPYHHKFSSYMSPCELIDCRIGAVMLIDNYLLDDSRKALSCKEYFVGKNAFKEFKKFYARCKNASLSEIKSKYELDFLPKFKK